MMRATMDDGKAGTERRQNALNHAQNARVLIGIRQWWLLSATAGSGVPDVPELFAALSDLCTALDDRPDDIDPALDLAALLAPYWLTRGEWSEAERWFALLLARQSGNVERRSEIARTWSVIARNRGELDLARRLSDRALEFARAGSDRTLIATALNTATGARVALGDFEEAERLGAAACELAREIADPLFISRATQALAMAYLTSGKLALARKTFMRALQVDREAAPQVMSLAHLLDSIAMCSLYERDYPVAQQHALEALERSRFEGSRVSEAWSQHHLAAVAWRLDRPHEARRLTEAAIETALAVGYTMILIREVEEVASWLARRGDSFEAAVLVAGAARARTDLQAPLAPFEERDACERESAIAKRLAGGMCDMARGLGDDLALPLVIARMRAVLDRVADAPPLHE